MCRSLFGIWTNSVFLKISFAVAAFSSFVLLQGYAISSFSAAKRRKIYRLEFGVVLNLLLIPGSKYLWKRLVKDTSDFFSVVAHQFWKLIVVVLLVFAHFCPFTTLLITKEPFFPVICWLAFGTYLSLLLMFGISKTLQFICKPVFGPTHMTRVRVTGLVTFLSMMIIWTAFGIASSPPIVIRVEVPVRKLPPSMDKLRIALLSDIHLGPTVGLHKLNRIVDMTNELRPDVVVLAGDLTDITVEDADEMAVPLKYLNPPMGKFFVSGNHEYMTGDVDNWFQLLKSYGFNVLHNSNSRLRKNANDKDWICIMGTDDLQARTFSYEGHGMDLRQAYKGCNPDHTTILVAHQPKAAKYALDSNYGIDLVLAGHTHAGQIFPFTIVAYLANPFFHGLYQYKNGHVYVTQGTAYYGFPLRLFSHPEITEIFLRTA